MLCGVKRSLRRPRSPCCIGQVVRPRPPPWRNSQLKSLSLPWSHVQGLQEDCPVEALVCPAVCLPTLVSPSWSWSLLRIPFFLPTHLLLFLLLLQWEAKAWSSHHRDGGMTGWEGAADGLQERLMFNVGLGFPIIPLQRGSK